MVLIWRGSEIATLLYACEKAKYMKAIDGGYLEARCLLIDEHTVAATFSSTVPADQSDALSTGSPPLDRRL